jgi:hypothetical protein
MDRAKTLPRCPAVEVASETAPHGASKMPLNDDSIGIAFGLPTPNRTFDREAVFAIDPRHVKSPFT